MKTQPYGFSATASDVLPRPRNPVATGSVQQGRVKHPKTNAAIDATALGRLLPSMIATSIHRSLDQHANGVGGQISCRLLLPGTEGLAQLAPETSQARYLSFRSSEMPLCHLAHVGTGALPAFARPRNVADLRQREAQSFGMANEFQPPQITFAVVAIA